MNIDLLKNYTHEQFAKLPTDAKLRVLINLVAYEKMDLIDLQFIDQLDDYDAENLAFWFKQIMVANRYKTKIENRLYLNFLNYLSTKDTFSIMLFNQYTQVNHTNIEAELYFFNQSNTPQKAIDAFFSSKIYLAASRINQIKCAFFLYPYTGKNNYLPSNPCAQLSEEDLNEVLQFIKTDESLTALSAPGLTVLLAANPQTATTFFLNCLRNKVPYYDFSLLFQFKFIPRRVASFILNTLATKLSSRKIWSKSCFLGKHIDSF